MKAGTIVVVLPFGPIHPAFKARITWLPVADEKTPYMVRGSEICPVFGVRVYFLEEGIIGYNENGDEFGIEEKLLRELLPPEDISEVMEEIQTDFIALPLNL